MDRNNTSIWDYYRINMTTRREPEPEPDPDTDSDFDPNAEAAIPTFEEVFASPGIPEDENNPPGTASARPTDDLGDGKATDNAYGDEERHEENANGKIIIDLGPNEREWSRYFAGYYTSRPKRTIYTAAQDTGRQPSPRQGHIDAEIKTWPLMSFNIQTQPKTITDMPPSFVALDDPWVFLCIMFFDLQHRYKAWPNDFMAEGRMRMFRPPVGGGVYVYFEPTGYYYMAEAFGYYLLGGDAVGRTGKWVYRSLRSSQYDPKDLPELSFGNFRMPASWKPGAEDLVLRYKVKGDDKLVMRATPWSAIPNKRLPRFWYENEFALSEWSPDEKVGWISVDGSAERKLAERWSKVQKNAASQETSTPIENGSEQQSGTKRSNPPTLASEIRAPKKRHSAPTSGSEAFDKRASNLAHRPLTAIQSQRSFSARPSSNGSTCISMPLHEEIFPSSREADRRKTLTEILSRSHTTQPSASTLPSASFPQIPPDQILIKKSELDNLRAQRDLFYESHLRSILDWSTLLGQQKAHWGSELDAIQALVEANNVQYEALKARFVHVQSQMLALEGLEKRGPRNEEVSIAGFPPLRGRFEGLVGSEVDGELDVIRGKVKELYERVGETEIHDENGNGNVNGNVSAGSAA